jgi:hypothetical protein
MHRRSRLAWCLAAVSLVAYTGALFATKTLKAQKEDGVPPAAAVAEPAEPQDPQPLKPQPDETIPVAPGPAVEVVAPPTIPGPAEYFDPGSVPPQITTTVESTPSLTPQAVDDPEAYAVAVIDRTRHEAEVTIKRLNDEAASLRTRLKKVESAIARWESLLSAIAPEGRRGESMKRSGFRPAGEPPVTTPKARNLIPTPDASEPSLEPELPQKPQPLDSEPPQKK